MAIKGNAATASSTAAVIYHSSSYRPHTVSITNLDASVALLIGASTLTRTNYAYSIAAGASKDVVINYGEDLYAITASGASAINAHVMAIGA